MILVRLYGRNTDLIIDRSAERRNMNIMHSLGSGPPLIAVLNNALVYGFVVGEPTTVTVIREPVVRQMVAKEMAKMHCLDLSPHSGNEIPSHLNNFFLICFIFLLILL